MDIKICVYAIAKNEVKFIDRWYNSVKEADYICVLDTGSTDGSFEKFKSLGIITSQKQYSNFRFDVARNDSIKLIPKDATICVCVDIDEMFEPGWSKILKQNWQDNTIRARYRYTWNFNADGSEGVVFLADKIHKNGAFIWQHPVHEVLKPINSSIKGNALTLPSIQLNHRADNSKSRSNYLPLLELTVQDMPKNDSNMHYLGREYMFYGEYKKAISTLKRHLALPTATWDAERSASLRYIAECYKHLNQYKKQIKYLHLAILEAPYMREAIYSLAVEYFNRKEYEKSVFYFLEMLKIEKRELNYISSPDCWGSLPYDYLSMCFYYMKNYAKALFYVEKAISVNSDERLKNNKQIFINLINEKGKA